jgi:hypothetical protein
VYIKSNFQDKIVSEDESGTRKIVGYGQGDDNSELEVSTKNLDGEDLDEGEYTVYVWAQRDNQINSHEGSEPVYFTLKVTTTPDDPDDPDDNDDNDDDGDDNDDDDDNDNDDDDDDNDNDNDDVNPGTNPSYPSSSGSGSNSVTPATSTNNTTPTEIIVFLRGTSETAGTTIKAKRQTDGAYLIIVPYGTDITTLAPEFILPSGAAVSPPSGTARDFSAGPLPYVVTAANGTTKQTYLVAVRVQSPAQTERPYFSILPSDCEIGYVINADGTVTASLRVLLADGSDPSLVEAVRATISGLTVSNVSYAYVDANGAVIPLPARNAAAAPYLQITFTAPSLGALEKGVLEKITYWLKDDETEYVQTYSTITFPDLTFVDETPPNDGETIIPNNSNHGGGCDSGAAIALGLAGIISAGIVTLGKKRGG